MAVAKLADIQAMIETLDLDDQARLLQYLTPKIAGAILSQTSSPSSQISAKPEAGWQSYRCAGERLAATSTPGSASLTDAMSESRR